MLQLLLKLTSIVNAFILRWPSAAERIFVTSESLLLRWKPTATNTGAWFFLLRQRWQFLIERSFYLRGEKRVDDPLFDCEMIPHKDKNVSKIQKPAGRFRISMHYNGLMIVGKVFEKKTKRIEITLNGILLRKTTVLKNKYIHIKITRAALQDFPVDSILELKTQDGEPLLYKNHTGVRLLNPSGSGLILKSNISGSRLTKKGGISQSAEKISERQNAYLQIYAKARKFFLDELHMPLFLMYGTLLGVYRGGDFIPGDDDFDGGYVSFETDPVRVLEETKQIIQKLVQAGFTVTFNRRGRLFRLQTEKGSTDGFHLDLRPLWFSDGNMYAHKHACIPATVSDFLPVQTRSLRGIDVDLPQNPETLLAGYYGPGWKVPDPGYVNDESKVPIRIRKILSKAYLSPREYMEMQMYLQTKQNEYPEMGRFVSTSLQNLYPLEDYIG